MAAVQWRTLDQAGLGELLARAQAEGWNPGVDDAAAFHHADTKGFRARFVDGQFAAGISVVRQNAQHGFLGLYIADAAFRGQGHGLALWEEALAHLEDRSVGLDGVLEQQANYRQSGFVFHHRNIRYEGEVPRSDSDGISPGTTLRMPTQDDLPDLLALDAAIGGVERRTFLSEWFHGPESSSRLTLLAESDREIVGVGTIRACAGPHKIGPLLAPDAKIARQLAGALCEKVGATRVMVDVPEPNQAGTEWLERAGLKPVFETARMYRGAPPLIDLERVFGVATLELG